MNKQQVTQMQAGRELDALIQDIVLPGAEHIWCELDTTDYCSACGVERWQNAAVEPCRPWFSESRMAALSVIAAMAAQGFDVNLSLRNGLAWRCEFTRPSEEFSATADTMALAICGAALLPFCDKLKQSGNLVDAKA